MTFTDKDVTQFIVGAIYFRDQCRSGLRDSDWVREGIVRLIEEGFWNDSHIAALAGYARQSVSKLGRGRERPAQRPRGGTLDPGCLDLILELRAAVLAGKEASPGLVASAVKTGTSTRLIARLSGVRIGVVLYQQRRLKDGDGNG